MSNKIKIFLLIIIYVNCFAQSSNRTEKTGIVTIVTSQNIYVRFESTKGILKDDTLYSLVNNEKVPVVIVKFISTSSVSGSHTGSIQLKVGDPVKAFIKSEIKPNGTEAKTDTTQNRPVTTATEYHPKSIIRKRTQGRFTISSYSDLSNTSGIPNYQRWRYSFSYNADSIGNSPVSLSSYVNFLYRADQWSDVKNNIGSGTRIYDLSLKYDVSKSTWFTLGRKINFNTSSLGAIDGLQFESVFKGFIFGVIAGSRPDFTNYSYNAKLFEYGGYIARTDSIGNASVQNSIGLFQQTNDLTTDRRFLYYQNTTNPTQNLSFFFSTEIDLYKRNNGLPQNTFDLTSLYLISSYTPTDWLSFSASYDARKNTVYWETFKTIPDSILQSAIRTGLSLRMNIRPYKYIWLSGYFGYEASKYDPSPSRNYGTTIGYNMLPIIQSSAFFSYNRIETGYVSGNYYSANLSKDLLEGFVNLGIGYKHVAYDFTQSSIAQLLQNIGSLDLSFRIYSTSFLSLTYEGTFEQKNTYTRLYINLSTRF